MIKISDFNYSLPESKIAQYPLKNRDESKLLVYKDGKIKHHVFREISNTQMQSPASLFSVRKAWWYIPRSHLGFGDRPKGTQGDSYFTAKNPPFGAVFTYYLKSDSKSSLAIRQDKEKALLKDGKSVGFPGWDAVEKERREDEEFDKKEK